MAPITKAARDLRRKLTPTPALTQKQLSEKLGVTQQAISAWLRGVARPDLQRRAQLEELTGVPASDWDIAGDTDSTPDLSGDADDSGEHAAVTTPTANTGTS